MKIYSFFLIIFFAVCSNAQNLEREFEVKPGATIEITNHFGRVEVLTKEREITDEAVETEIEKAQKVSLTFKANKQISENEIKSDNSGKSLKIEVAPDDAKTRIDLTLTVPARSRLKIDTVSGEVRVDGDFASAEVKTETGTIAANVPLENLKYDFVWTESRPRFLSDVELKEVKEKAAGKFVINGEIKESSKFKVQSSNSGEEIIVTERSSEKSEDKEKEKEDKGQKTKDKGQTKLNFTTARGIVLLNVNPNEVPSNLRERPLTEAAKAVIRSGDSLLTEAIRRASPKRFGEYAKTLPPRKQSPFLTEKKPDEFDQKATIKKVTLRVSDLNNRAISNLKAADFEVSESGEKREILAVEQATAPFNLVLLLDVSGSVDNYVDFIRKAARNFVNTVSAKDRISIIIFNEDVKTIATFTTDKQKLSESLDTFDAGGGTAFYDAIAYTLVDSLKPLKGERTAIVVLSDGDDNRSFLPFDSLLGSIQESGALVYPLYVPSDLIAASAANEYKESLDPLRTRYMALTTKAESEGAKLAQVSGGVYYPIKQLSELQKAYNDIVAQLRTAYTLTFRSNFAESGENRVSPRLKVKVKRENAFVKLSSVVEVSNGENAVSIER